MRLKIVQAGDPVLRREARPLTVEEIALDPIQQLIEHMRETMRDAPGVGLAAPQIGLPIQLVVIEDRAEYLKAVDPAVLAERERGPVDFLVLANPRIVNRSARTAEFFEGCLSVAGFSALVQRSSGGTVEYLDAAGKTRVLEAAGWLARSVQHELDHLDVRLSIDRRDTLTCATIDDLGR